MVTTFLDKVWDIWTAGGWTMIPLAILGLMIYSAAVRMFLYFSHREFHKVTEAECVRWLKDPETGKGEIGEIIRYTQDEVASVDEIHSRFAEVMVAKMPFIDRNITFINILVTAAPLIGLLGTVMGMFMTFQSIGMGGGEMAEMMAKGISAALFPPEVGLCIALPGLMMVHLLKRKRDEYDAFLAKLESFTVQQYTKNDRGLVPQLITQQDPRPNAGVSGEESALNPA